MKPLSEMTTEEVLAYVKELQQKRELSSEERILARARASAEKKPSNTLTNKEMNDILKTLESMEDEE